MYLTSISFEVFRGWAGGSQRNEDCKKHSNALDLDGHDRC